MPDEIKQTTKDTLEQPKATEQEDVQFEDDGTVDFRNINDLIEVVDAEPTSDPVKVSEQVKIFNGILYFYDYSDRTWKQATGGFVDMGDVSSQFNLTIDGSFHDLDITSVVPANTEFIILKVFTVHTSVGNKVKVAPLDYANTTTLYNPISTGGYMFATIAVVDGQIRYNVDNTFSTATLTITAYQ